MSDLIRHHVYRAKRPRRIFIGFDEVYDDRMILHLTETKVQYDSPTVRDGRRYPSVDRDKFEKWAGADVTEGYPAGDWAEWPSKDAIEEADHE